MLGGQKIDVTQATLEVGCLLIGEVDAAGIGDAAGRCRLSGVESENPKRSVELGDKFGCLGVLGPGTVNACQRPSDAGVGGKGVGEDVSGERELDVGAVWACGWGDFLPANAKRGEADGGDVLEGCGEERVLHAANGTVDLQMDYAACGEQEVLQVRRRGECAGEAGAFGSGRNAKPWVNAPLVAEVCPQPWPKEFLKGSRTLGARTQADVELPRPCCQPGLDVRRGNVGQEHAIEGNLTVVRSEGDGAGKEIEAGVLGRRERASEFGFSAGLEGQGRAKQCDQERCFHGRCLFLILVLRKQTVPAELLSGRIRKASIICGYCLSPQSLAKR